MQDTDGNGRQEWETFLTISETARLLRLSERSAYRLARTGGLPGAVRFGSQWRVDREVLMAWVKEQGRARGDAGGMS